MVGKIWMEVEIKITPLESHVASMSTTKKKNKESGEVYLHHYRMC